jgi:hypothetical protein
MCEAYVSYMDTEVINFLPVIDGNLELTISIIGMIYVTTFFGPQDVYIASEVFKIYYRVYGSLVTK